MNPSQSLDVLVPQRRALWDGIKGIPGSMQLVDIPRLQNTWAYGYVVDGVKYLAAGAVVDAIRRAFVWLYHRLKLRYSTSAEFILGDPAYEWIVLFLTENNVWQKARDFRVTSKSSKLVYGVTVSADPDITGSADFVPTYEAPQLFRWRGYWVEVQRYRAQIQGANGQPQQAAAIYVTVYTRKLSVLSELVEEAHRGYQAKVKPYVTIFLADSPSFGGSFLWNVKRKPHRPIESIILPDGVLDDLISDAKRFFSSEAWYHRAGIPHRRGYLLFGPPGTGKSSTIHAVAGELNLEIHSFSLSSALLPTPIRKLALITPFPSSVDDAFLQRAVATIPKRSIVLVEDIDCVLPSREEDDDSDGGSPVRRERARHGGVTLSGLLNMIDGIGSEEGKLFFATTNYVDRLDPALMRPGRIDRRIRYTLATGAQARRLFERLFKDAEVDMGSRTSSAFAGEEMTEPDVPSAETGEPQLEPQRVDPAPEKINSSTLSPPSGVCPERAESVFPSASPVPLAEAPATPDLSSPPPPRTLSDAELAKLAQQFASAMRDYEFSPAELQGYLLSNRECPVAAAAEMGAWVARQRAERQEKEELKAERKERVRATRARIEAVRFQQQQQYTPYPPFPPPPLGMLPPLPPPPPPPAAPEGDVDVAAAPPAALSPPAAATTAAPALPPCEPPATPIPNLDHPASPAPESHTDPPHPKHVNGINGTS